MTPMECRLNEEVCHVLHQGEPTNTSQMSTSVPLSLSRHRYPTHLFQHPLPPTTPQQPSLSRISASPHSPPCTPAHTTRTLQNGPTERAATLHSPPPPSPTHPSTHCFPTHMPPTLLTCNSTPLHPTCR